MWRIPITLTCALLLVNGIVLLAEPFLLRLARYEFAPTAEQIVVYADAPRPDLLFMGSSRAVFGLDPAVAEAEVARLTGRTISALNGATLAGATDLNYLILKNIVTETKKPAIIVYGLAEFELMQVPGYDACQFPYFDLLLRPEDFAFCPNHGIEDYLNFALNQTVPLYRDRELIRDGVSIWLNPDDPLHQLAAPGPEHETLRSDGFGTWPKNDIETARVMAADRQAIRSYLSQFQFDAARVARLNDFLDLAHARGIQVVLVNMPVAPEFLTLWDDPESMARYSATVRAIAQQHGVPLVDLYANLAEGQLSADSFIDLHHLDPDGAAVVTRLVVDREVVPRLP